MARQSYLLITRRQEVNEIVELLFSPQNTLHCISEKLVHTEVILPRALKKKNKQQKKRAEATAYGSPALPAVTALPSRH